MLGTQGAQPHALFQPGWVGWGGGGRLSGERMHTYLWLIDVVVWQKPSQYYKAIILQLKKKKKETTKVPPERSGLRRNGVSGHLTPKEPNPENGGTRYL